MKSTYFEDDDILQIRMSDKPIAREVSQDWHTNISYAEDGTIVEIVLLDAKRKACCLLSLGKWIDAAHRSHIADRQGRMWASRKSWNLIRILSIQENASEMRWRGLLEGPESP